MRRGLAISALIFFIIGIVGLVFTSRLSESGSVNWIQGSLTFGAFIAVGLAIIVALMTSDH